MDARAPVELPIPCKPGGLRFEAASMAFVRAIGYETPRNVLPPPGLVLSYRCALAPRLCPTLGATAASPVVTRWMAAVSDNQGWHLHRLSAATRQLGRLQTLLPRRCIGSGDWDRGGNLRGARVRVQHAHRPFGPRRGASSAAHL